MEPLELYLTLCTHLQFILLLGYRETFAPIAKVVSVRCFLSVVVAREWELHQMDTNNAFLHGDIDEEVYMILLLGFHICSSHKVCKLKKSLFMGVC